MEDQISNHEFPLSPSGVLLLEMIKRIIEENGGREKMHDIIVAEIKGHSYQVEKLRLDEVFKTTIQYKTPYRAAAVIAGMTYFNFCTKLEEYKRKHHIVDPP